ncbi:hypothetical protein LJC73_07095, partial [Bacteroidales bacterium OttesenSCG-928-L14]|nr:hypothetical protein [Bacteroidales bacterium OttesenSCG-928-L14]
MKKLNSILYASMFALTMCFLFMSAIQREFKIFEVKPLKGVLPETKVKEFNFKNYYDFSFQRNLEKKIERTFGFREPLIRLYNQYSWDFYKKNPSTMVLIGEDNWLYPNWHLKGVPITDELLMNFDMQARFTHQLTGILKEYNTELLVCFIPGKTDIYPEHMGKKIMINDFNPMKYYYQKFEEYDINFIDLTDVFLSYKDTAIFQPFTQTGTHWSNITSVYSIDSILKTFERLSELHIPELEISKPYIDSIRTPDNDLELLLNLARSIEQPDNYYVDVNIIEDSSTYHPKMITIGDSHFWNVTYNIPLREMFSSYPYWYYGKTIYFDKTHRNISEVDLCNELFNTDYLLLLYSSYQTYNFGSGVLVNALLSICIDDNDLNAEIEKIIKKINSDTKWVENMTKKAAKNNITLEEAIYNDALYMIKSDPYKYFPSLDVDIPTVRSKKFEFIMKYSNNNHDEEEEVNPIKKIINEMRQSETWMNNLKEKAKKQNKTI